MVNTPQPHNNLSRRTAMIYLMPIMSRRTATTTRFRVEQPNAYGAKLLTIPSGNRGHYLVSIHQMAPPERGAHIR